MKLRYYQNDAVGSIFAYFTSGAIGNPIVAMPTGTGKSLVIADFLRQVYALYPNQRVIKLTHVKELIVQNLEKTLAIWPTAPVGVFSAGLGRKEITFPITFAGIASVAKLATRFGHIDLILVDECHLISAKEETLYMLFIGELKKINPNLKVIGFSATPWRLGAGHLTDKIVGKDGNLKSQLFTDVCYDITGMEGFNRLISEGYLSTLIPKNTNVELKVDGVKVRGGEFVEKELQAAVGNYELTMAACREAVALGQDRKHWLVFTTGIEHAVLTGEILTELEISNVVIHSKLHPKVRDKAIADFKASKYQAAVTNNMLTTGFDFPLIDMIVVLRPTNSPVLWVQMLGRGTRPVYVFEYDLDTVEGRLRAIEAGPKPNCLVLDFARNTRRLGPINDPVIPKAKGGKGGGTAPVKLCEECGTYNHASVRYCVNCGQEFPKELKISLTSSTDELIRKEETFAQFELFQVDRVVYIEHRKEGRPPTIQVSYFCGLRMFREWICLEHEGFARKRARDWWRRATMTNLPPETTAEALERLHELRPALSISVRMDTKHPEVVERHYE